MLDPSPRVRFVRGKIIFSRIFFAYVLMVGKQSKNMSHKHLEKHHEVRSQGRGWVGYWLGVRGGEEIMSLKCDL